MTKKKLLPEYDELLLEHELESCLGKCEIYDGFIHRWMPDCSSKSAVILRFYEQHFFDDHGFSFLSGSAGIQCNGMLLSPDANIYITADRPVTEEMSGHMCTNRPAPHWVMKYEWLEEAYEADKGHDKIVNKFFGNDYVGTADVNGNPTHVEEAWLLVCRLEDPCLPVEPEVILNGAHDVSHVVLEPSEEPPPPNPPAVDGIRPPYTPYLAIYTRGHLQQPRAYYYLQWNSWFRPPDYSFLHGMPDVSVNYLFRTMISA